MKIERNPPDDIRLQAAMVTAEALISYGLLETDEKEESAKQIAKVARMHMDGYELAKDLDNRFGWNVSAQTVECLDGHSSTLEKARDVWLKEQVKGLKPPFEVGARVQWGENTGTITGIYEYRPASYLIKRDGEEGADTDRQTRSIVWFDQVKAA